MDVMITGVAFTGLLLFLLFHATIIRLLPHRAVVVGLMASYLASFLLLTGLLLLLRSDVPIAVVLFSVFLFTLFIASYVLGIFGMVVSSLRFRLLSELYRAHPKGIRLDQLLKRYNREVIIDGRLKRLVAAGDLVYQNGKYHLGRRFSVFTIHQFIFDVLNKLYG